MQHFVDHAWDMLSPHGVSWVGFYVPAPGAATEMRLAARRDKPACSPIGVHGACGRCFTSRRTLVVADVAALGENYVACDPRDRSELVIPCFEEDGECWGVLDLDSFEVGAFSDFDATALHAALAAARLTHGPEATIERVPGP